VQALTCSEILHIKISLVVECISSQNCDVGPGVNNTSYIGIPSMLTCTQQDSLLRLWELSLITKSAADSEVLKGALVCVSTCLLNSHDFSHWQAKWLGLSHMSCFSFCGTPSFSGLFTGLYTFYASSVMTGREFGLGFLCFKHTLLLVFELI